MKEYFILDPYTKETITYYHDGGVFVKQESGEEKIVSKVLGKEFKF